ncbi:MAG: cadherin-like beta sandwich domain-containing protein [Lachnospiraceae bacterium]|nr:cadherin-like beta sandwich domain-containing protein [Lachnospiraceae bacterium]
MNTCTSELGITNVLEYTCEVNADVESVVINAYPEDNDAKVEVKGNENLKTGENKVEIQVIAPNNNNKKNYVVRVTKLETGVTPGGQSVIDGQRIVSEKYYVTYMDFPEDAKPFDGYVQGKAYIFDNELTVWVEEGNNDPQYCIFYGMDPQGDIGYYRYDKYKYTIQRNFQDPGSEKLRLQAMNEEAAVNNYNKLAREQKVWIIACICLGAFSIILIVIVIIMLVKKGGKPRSTFRKEEDFVDDEEEDDDDFFAPKKETIKRTIPDKPVETQEDTVENAQDNNSLDIEDLD